MPTGWDPAKSGRERVPTPGRYSYKDVESATEVDVIHNDTACRPIARGASGNSRAAARERLTLSPHAVYSSLENASFGLLVDEHSEPQPVLVRRLKKTEQGYADAAPGPDVWLGSCVKHPNVAKLLDLVPAGAETLAAFEYVAGETLIGLVQEGNRLPIPISIAVMRGVLDALHAAHTARNQRREAASIIHGALGPECIVVCSDGRARVFDFAVQRQNSERARPLGRSGYAAPEQVFDQDVDERSDVFAAGVVLWECLAGRRLLEGASAVDRMLRFIANGATPPSQHNPAVSPELDAVVLRALESTGERRFASAVDMVRALVAAAEPADAREVTRYLDAIAWSSLERQRALVADLVQGADTPVQLLSFPNERASTPLSLVRAPLREEDPTPLFPTLQEDPTRAIADGRDDDVAASLAKLRQEEPTFIPTAKARPEGKATPAPPSRDSARTGLPRLSARDLKLALDGAGAPQNESYWAQRDANETTAVEGKQAAVPELSDAVSDNEGTDPAKRLDRAWASTSIAGTPSIVAPPRTAHSLMRTTTRRRLAPSPWRKLLLVASLIGAFVGAFFVGSLLRERGLREQGERAPAKLNQPSSPSAAAARAVPSVAALHTPAARVSGTPRATPSAAPQLPVMRIEDLPLTTETTKGRSKHGSKRGAAHR